jgi:hypothetical protein
MSLDAFADAALAALQADEGLTVFDGPAPDLQMPPYVVVYFSVDSEGSDRFTVESTDASLRLITHCVGANTKAARIVAGRVRALLLDTLLEVEGLKPFPVRHEYGLPPTADQSTGHLVVDAVDGWTAKAVTS